MDVSPYSRGERAAQARASVGEAADRSARAIRSDIPDVATTFLAEQPMLITASIDAGGAVWASLLTGPPGFVSVLDPATVRIVAEPAGGDPLAALADGGLLGLLAIEPSSRRRMRLNGRAHRHAEGGLVVDVDQVVANCPKYITERRPTLDPDAGEARASAGADTATRLSHAQRTWVAEADTFFLATASEGGADASHRGGDPGFVEVVDDRHLMWPDYAGNAMFLSFGNLEVQPRAGLLFVDWEGGATLQVTGTARVEWGAAARFPEAERAVAFDVDHVVEIDGANGLRWVLERYSRFNPPARTPTHPSGS